MDRSLERKVWACQTRAAREVAQAQAQFRIPRKLSAMEIKNHKHWDLWNEHRWRVRIGHITTFLPHRLETIPRKSTWLKVRTFLFLTVKKRLDHQTSSQMTSKRTRLASVRLKGQTHHFRIRKAWLIVQKTWRFEATRMGKCSADS